MRFRGRACLPTALAMACGAGLTLAIGQGRLGLALIAAAAAAALLWRSSRDIALPNVSEPGPSATVLGQEADLRTRTAIVDNAPIPLLRFGAGGGLETLNKSARRLFGTDGVVLAPTELLVDTIARAQPGQRETVSVPYGTGVRPFSLSVVDVAGLDGPFRLVALVDIQPQIRAAEAAAMKNLVEVLSHEIMNSLSAITSMSLSVHDALASHGDGAGRLVAATEVISQRSQGLLRFVEGYRALARVPDPVVDDVSITDLLKKAHSLFVGRWRNVPAELTVGAPAPDIIIRADQQLLLQAVSTLLTNAVESSRLAERVADIHLDAGLSGANRPYITVTDNGIGLADLDHSQIFKPFFTTKTGGSGIGLGIAKQIVLSHGGDITAEARDDGLPGARFTLHL